MNKIVNFSLIIFCIMTCPALAKNPTCESSLQSCREVTSSKHCHCHEVCALAISLCKKEKKLQQEHDAQALLDQCKVTCPKK